MGEEKIPVLFIGNVWDRAEILVALQSREDVDERLFAFAAADVEISTEVLEQSPEIGFLHGVRALRDVGAADDNLCTVVVLSDEVDDLGDGPVGIIDGGRDY